MPDFANNLDIPAKKKLIRKEKLQQLKEFYGKREDNYIVNTLLSRSDYKSAKIILAFVPMKTEPDITPLLADERVAIPFIEDGRMYFSKDKKLQRGKLGFLEPMHEKIEIGKAIVLVPLLAFDSRKHRLGRGGGYYDCFIRENKDKLYTIGVAYSISKVDELPIEPFDEILDEIIYQENTIK